MESYAFIFHAFTYVNTIILIISSIISIIVLRDNRSKVLKTVAYYLVVCCCSDLITGLIVFLLKRGVIEGSATILTIIFRLIELLIIGYLINKYWLKSRIVWLLIIFSSVYLFYDLFTFQSNGVLNYEARAQTTAIILLVGLIVANLLKQLKKGNEFSVTNQMLSMVFLAYFSIQLVYTVIQNFIINQSFTNKSFALFYSSYVLLHIVYYAALTFILIRNLKKTQLKL